VRFPPVRYLNPLSGGGWEYYIGTSIWSVVPTSDGLWDVAVASCGEPPDLRARIVAIGFSTADVADAELFALAELRSPRELASAA
jgi:hypothetical protein